MTTETVKAAVLFEEALEELRKASDALDQARSMLRDLNLLYLGTGSGPGFITIGQMAERAGRLVENLIGETCENCGKLLRENPGCLVGCEEVTDNASH
jgi:hypothetical protein